MAEPTNHTAAAVVSRAAEAARANKRAERANRDSAIANRQLEQSLEEFCAAAGITIVRQAVERPPLPGTPGDTGRSRG